MSSYSIKKIFILIVGLCSAPLYAQTFEWFQHWGGNYTAVGVAVCTDDSGFVYVTGRFSGPMDFDPGPDTLNFTSVTSDAYVCKYDSSGNFVWAKDLNGDRGSDIAVDSDGNVIIVGSFQGTEDLDPGPLVYNLSAYDGIDRFVCKLDHAGNFLWAKAIGGPGYQASVSVACDSKGNIYVAGSFRDTVFLDQQAIVSQGNSDGFIAKMDSAGNYLWHNTLAGPGYQYVNAVACDSRDNPYIYGVFNGRGHFSPQNGVPQLYSSGTTSDAYIGKLSPQGDALWLKGFGGNGDLLATDIHTSDSGYVYLTGEYWGLCDFDPSAGTAYHQVVGTSDAFVSKLDGTGNLIWARSLGGPGYDRGEGVTSDRYGNVYINGYFNDSSDFDPGPGFSWKTSVGSSDIFLCKLNSGGRLDWAGSIGSMNTDFSGGIASDGRNSFYSSGDLSLTVDVDPNAGINSVNIPSNSAAFIHKMKSCTENYHITDTVCQSYTTAGGRNTWTTSGHYLESITVPGTCDTIKSYDLTVLADTAYIDTTVCEPLISPSQNFMWNQSGTYYDTLYPLGCQKIIKVELLVDSANTMLSRNHDSLISLDTSSSYQWIHCDSTLIAGANGQSFTPTANGRYAVILSKLYCVDTSACIEVNDIALPENGLAASINVYPNPFEDELKVELGSNVGVIEVELRDASGQLIYKNRPDRNRTLKLTPRLEAGVYVLMVKTTNFTSFLKVIKY